MLKLHVITASQWLNEVLPDTDEIVDTALTREAALNPMTMRPARH